MKNPTKKNNPSALKKYYDFSCIREIRKKKSLTIFELSEKSQVPASAISRIERNKCIAELSTLTKISEAFNMHPSELLRLCEHNPAERMEVQHRKSKNLSAYEINLPSVRIIFLDAKKGAKISNPEIHRDDFEICWVLKGKIAVHLPKQTETIQSNETVKFDALLKHNYQILTDSQILMIHISKNLLK